MTTQPKPNRSNRCSACGTEWTKHMGIAGTCQKLQQARTALKVICTLAKYHNGELLAHTAKLCRKALDETAPDASTEHPTQALERMLKEAGATIVDVTAKPKS